MIDTQSPKTCQLSAHDGVKYEVPLSTWISSPEQKLEVVPATGTASQSSSRYRTWWYRSKRCYDTLLPTNMMTQNTETRAHATFPVLYRMTLVSSSLELGRMLKMQPQQAPIISSRLVSPLLQLLNVRQLRPTWLR